MTVSKLSVPLKEALGYYAEGTTIPQNTNVDGATALQTGNTNGQIEVVLTAATAIALADTTSVTLTVNTSATEGGTYVALATATDTMSGATTYDVDDVVLSAIIPATSGLAEEWTKVNIATTDAAATGTFNCAIRYIVS